MIWVQIRSNDEHEVSMDLDKLLKKKNQQIMEFSSM